MFTRLPVAIILCVLAGAPAWAQGQQFNSSAAQGDVLHGTNYTGSGSAGMGGVGPEGWMTGPQGVVNLPTGFGQVAAGAWCPPTILNSLVASSGYNDLIYGDEGTDGPPPYNDFLTIGAGLGGNGETVGGSANPPGGIGQPLDSSFAWTQDLSALTAGTDVTLSTTGTGLQPLTDASTNFDTSGTPFGGW